MATLPFPSTLQFGILQKRYNRFLADIVLDDGKSVTAHCPNSGKLPGLCNAGIRVAVSYQSGGTRKYPWTWEAVDDGGTLVGINTARPNRLTGLALASGLFAEVGGYIIIRPEAAVPGGRLDFHLSGGKTPDCWLEVKNVTLKRKGCLEFPDCRTERGEKHLRILADIAQSGQRAVLLFLAQRNDSNSFRVAADIDPAYAAAFRQAVDAGVEVYCYTCILEEGGMRWHQRVVVSLFP